MMLRQFLNPPNWFSAASLFCGLYAMILSGQAEGNTQMFYQAGLMIVFAGVFDMLDGRVARMTGTASAFGVQLDSLIDIISFGLAPSVLLYFWALEPLGLPGVFIAFFFMLCGAFRLARFNVLADTKSSSKFSQGLTITMAGGTLATLIMWAATSGMAALQSARLMVPFSVTISLLMISSIPFRGLKTLKLSPKILAVIVVALAALLALGSMYNISLPLLLIGTTHIVSGPLEAMVTFPRRRRARRNAPRDVAAREPEAQHPQDE